MELLGIPNGQPLCKEFEVKEGVKPKGKLKMQLKFNANPEKCERLEDLLIPEKRIQGRLNIIVPNARQLPDTQLLGTPDPFVQVLLSNNAKKALLQSPRIDNNLNPDWNYAEKLQIDIKESELAGLSVIFQVVNGSSVMGGTSIALQQMVGYPGTWINKYHKLKTGKEQKKMSYLYIQMQYESSEKELAPQQLQVPQV